MFKPSILGIPKSGGTFTVRFTSAVQKFTSYEGYFSETTDLTAEIINKREDSCDIVITSLGVNTEKTINYVLWASNNSGVKQFVLPINLHRAEGFTPASGSITAKYSGDYNIVSYYGKYQVDEWHLSTLDLDIQTNIINQDSSFIQFSVRTPENTSTEVKQKTINIQGESEVIRTYPYYLYVAANPEGRYLTGVGAVVVTANEQTVVTNVDISDGSITSLQAECNTAEVTISGNTISTKLAALDTKNEVIHTLQITAEDNEGNTLTATQYITQEGFLVELDTFDIFSGEAGRVYITGKYYGAVTSNKIITEGNWFKVDGVSYLNNKINIRVDLTANNTTKLRTGSITLDINDLNPVILNISQSARETDIQVWNDYEWAEQTDQDFIEYHIDKDGEVLYAGRAYKYPGSNIARFLVNDIVKNYVSSELVLDEGIWDNTGYFQKFDLITSTGTYKPIGVINDWSYQYFPVKDDLLSDPINGLVSSKQYFVVSYLNINNPTVTVDINGTEEDISTTKKGGYNYLFFGPDYELVCGNKITVTLGDNTLTYKVDDTKKYCLYYCNARGGWDSLLIDGNTKKTDSLQSETYTKRVKPLNEEFGKTKYLNTITSNWTLYTGYLTDQQAGKMHNLLESTKVYLHKLDTDEVIPVVITSSNCEFKTYSNNGNKMFYYTIEVEESQNKIRQ